MPIHLERISKRFGNTWALRDIDISLGKGEVLGILGAAASGKTTLARIIAGLETASTGNSDISGTSYLADSSKSGLTDTFFAKWKDHSSFNQKQIEDFDRSLNSSAESVIFDEPLSCLDDTTRMQQLVKIRSIAETGRSAVVLSSRFDTIAACADRLIVLSQGSVLQTGFAQEIYENPYNTSVAELTGLNNIFEGRRLTRSDSPLAEFQTIDGSHRLFVSTQERSRLGAINQNINLAIRPQHISIATGASFPEDNLLKAIVSEIRFGGPTTLVKLNAEGLELYSQVFRFVGLNVGDECMLGLPPHRIQVLAA